MWSEPEFVKFVGVPCSRALMVKSTTHETSKTFWYLGGE